MEVKTSCTSNVWYNRLILSLKPLTYGKTRIFLFGIDSWLAAVSEVELGKVVSREVYFDKVDFKHFLTSDEG